MFFLCMLVQLLPAGNIFDVFLPRYLVFLKLLKTFKIFYSAAKHFSLSFFLGFNFFCGIQYKIFLSQITRSVCHVFKLQAIKSLVYI